MALTPKEKAKRHREKVKANPEKLAKQKAYMKVYRENNRGRLSVMNLQRQKDKAVEIRLKRKGLSVDLETEVTNHDGLCDICGDEGDGRWKTLNIDHCHETNVYRGMLCTKCNRGLGLFRDRIDLLEKAKNYLNKIENN